MCHPTCRQTSQKQSRKQSPNIRATSGEVVVTLSPHTSLRRSDAAVCFHALHLPRSFTPRLPLRSLEIGHHKSLSLLLPLFPLFSGLPMLIRHEKSPLYHICGDASTDPILIPPPPPSSLHLPKRHFLQCSGEGSK